MKTVLLMGLLFLASLARAEQFVVTGPAAEEMYNSLSVQETEVRDEHGGPQEGVAKYGDKIGCEKEFAKNQTSCWIKFNKAEGQVY